MPSDYEGWRESQGGKSDWVGCGKARTLMYVTGTGEKLHA